MTDTHEEELCERCGADMVEEYCRDCDHNSICGECCDCPPFNAAEMRRQFGTY